MGHNVLRICAVRRNKTLNLKKCLLADCTYTLLGVVKNNIMTIFKLKSKTREFRVCLKNRKHTNHNWYKRTEIGGTFAPKTITHSFGFLWLGRIIFYCT